MENTTPSETKPAETAETPTGLCLEAFADAALPSAGEELEIIISEHPMPELVIDGDTENFIFRVNEFLWHYNKDHPSVFFKDGKLVEVTENETGEHSIKKITVPMLRRILGKFGMWKDFTTRKSLQLSIDDLKLILETQPKRLDNVPPLKGLYDGALLLKGHIHAAQGYDEETGYYLTRSYEIPTVPENPTEKDIASAKEHIARCLKDFRYAEPVDFDNTVLALATLIFRSGLDGPVPIWIVDKNTSGAGGTMLTQIVGALASGKIPTLYSTTKNQSEMEKTIRTALKNGDRYVIVDNITAETDWVSETLLSATSGTGEVTIRNMKTYESFTSKAKMFFAVNGINISIRADVTRRMFRTRLSTRHAAEEEKYPKTKTELMQEAAELHPMILWSFAVLYQAWRMSGYVPAKRCSGNMDEYPQWYTLCAGLLSFAGYTHLLENEYELQTTEDEVNTEKAQFINRLYEWKGMSPFTPKEIIDKVLIEADDNGLSLADGLLNFADDTLITAAKKRMVKTSAVGYWLKGYIGCKFAGCPYYLDKTRGSHITYVLKEVVSQQTL
ncbi:MAG TPA: hypothetical protein O0W95_03480 [Methanocorpusculum sp.]|nr:hypothetical protein [Methanocorpusculum sp.]